MHAHLNASRRRFVIQSLAVVAALPLLGAALSACTKTGGGGSDNPPEGETAVKEDDPVAASLGYKADASKVDTAKFPKRAGAEGAKQNCGNCQFYTAKSGGWGACQILRTGLVKEAGWCNTWAQKA